jgi:1,4-alpha-glucan branching enzyme
MAILLLAPSPPLLFMGEEFAVTTPFLFFCDFGPELAAKVSAARRAEFPHFSKSGLSEAEAKSQIPDPNSEETFLRSKLDWASVQQPPHQAWLEFYRSLLACRREEIVPRIRGIGLGRAQFNVLSPCAIRVRWPFVQGGGLELRANFGLTRVNFEEPPQGRLLYSTAENPDAVRSGEIPPLSAAWFLT